MRIRRVFRIDMIWEGISEELLKFGFEAMITIFLWDLDITKLKLKLKISRRSPLNEKLWNNFEMYSTTGGKNIEDCKISGIEANDPIELNHYRGKLHDENCQSQQESSINVWMIVGKLTRTYYHYWLKLWIHWS